MTEKEDFEIYPPDVKGNFRKINNLDEYLLEAFEKDVFLSELEIPWAKTVKSTKYQIAANYKFSKPV